MGGRGGAGGSIHSSSPEYQEHYNVEMQSVMILKRPLYGEGRKKQDHSLFHRRAEENA